MNLDGAVIDSSVIGGTTAAAGTFTTLTANTSITGTLATAAQTNITSVGTLTSLTVSGDATFDTSTLKVDSTNNRVGIGTASPATDLQIAASDTTSEIQFTHSGSGTGAGNGMWISANGNDFDIRNKEAGNTSLWTNNAERVTINSSGSVGIGTTSPTGKLNIVSGGSGSYLLNLDYNDGTDGGGYYESGSTDLSLFLKNSSATQTVQIATAGDSYFNGGNVGIGTASPTVESGRTGLHIHDGIGPELHMTDTASGTTASDGASIVFDNPNFYVANKEAGPIQFWTNGSEKMRLDSSGQVGIGTSSPLALLDVAVLSSGSRRLLVNYADSMITLQGANSSATNETLRITGDNLRFATGSGTGTERMRIDSSGSVGIGTASPSDVLDVTRTSTDQTVGLTLTNLQSGGYGSGIIFRSKRSDTSDIKDAAKIRVSGENSWNSDGTTDSVLIFDLIKDNSLSEKMRLTSEGRLCLGFTAKQQDAFLSIVSNGSEGLFNGTAGSNGWRRYYHTASDGIHRFQSSSNTATLSNAGAWGDASDIAYKKDIVDTVYGLDTVKQFQPRDFVLKEDETNQTGFIAQEMETVCPQFVVGEDGSKTINYGQITSVLTKAIQEQQEQIEELKQQINELRGN